MNNIKTLRKQQGLSVTELAERLNMSQSNLTKIENGQIELKQDTAEKIALALNVSAQALVENSIKKNGVGEYLLLNPEKIDLPPLSRLAIPSYMLKATTEQTVLFVVEDNTMTPLVQKGDLAVVDTGCASLTQDAPYIIKIAKRYYLRYLQQNSNNTVNILCEHRAYLPQTLNLTDIEIVGAVRGILNFKSI